jgi:hypothetical protein
MRTSRPHILIRLWWNRPAFVSYINTQTFFAGAKWKQPHQWRSRFTRLQMEIFSNGGAAVLFSSHVAPLLHNLQTRLQPAINHIFISGILGASLKSTARANRRDVTRAILFFFAGCVRGCRRRWEHALFTLKRALSYREKFRGGRVLKLMEMVIEFERCQTKGLKQPSVIYYTPLWRGTRNFWWLNLCGTKGGVILRIVAQILTRANQQNFNQGVGDAEWEQRELKFRKHLMFVVETTKVVFVLRASFVRFWWI